MKTSLNGDPLNVLSCFEPTNASNKRVWSQKCKVINITKLKSLTFWIVAISILANGTDAPLFNI